MNLFKFMYGRVPKSNKELDEFMSENGNFEMEKRFVPEEMRNTVEEFIGFLEAIEQEAAYQYDGMWCYFPIDYENGHRAMARMKRDNQFLKTGYAFEESKVVLRFYCTNFALQSLKTKLLQGS